MGGGNSANCPPAPESSMVTVPGSSEKARPDIAQKFVSMRAAAAADGVNLIINEGWRDDATQLRYWNNNHCDSGCSSPVARPCSKGGPGSNHEQGEAFDIKLSQDPNALKWLQSNASRFGFYNHLPTDLVHWSVTGY
jgi:LAS superfamily LD-carboxypeptidase LdcB